MKFDHLKSIAHNIADSLADGASLLINRWELQVFEEARRSPEGFLTVDFLTGRTTGATPSAYLADAVALFPSALADLCTRHGTTSAIFRELSARYTYDDVVGRRFEVTVCDLRGRRSVDEYDGIGRRVRILDQFGRVRRKPSISSY